MRRGKKGHQVLGVHVCVHLALVPHDSVRLKSICGRPAHVRKNDEQETNEIIVTVVAKSSEKN